MILFLWVPTAPFSLSRTLTHFPSSEASELNRKTSPAKVKQSRQSPRSPHKMNIIESLWIIQTHICKTPPINITTTSEQFRRDANLMSMLCSLHEALIAARTDLHFKMKTCLNETGNTRECIKLLSSCRIISVSQCSAPCRAPWY